MLIKLWDNEKYEYPLIEIKKEGFKHFEKQLKIYQKCDTYNYDDFINILKCYEWFIREITHDKEVFF